jgi:hypothetical protein
MKKQIPSGSDSAAETVAVSTDLQFRNFHRWIRNPIRRLSRQKDTGFAVAMITFPVLERWIRGKVGIKSRPLQGTDGDQFYAELAVQFEALHDPADGCFVGVAETFWQAFRNGILHQVTFSTKPIRAQVKAQPVFCAFVERSGVPIVTKHSPPSFLLDPYAFAEVTLSIIEKDFSHYKGADPQHHSLAIAIGSMTFAL